MDIGIVGCRWFGNKDYYKKLNYNTRFQFNKFIEAFNFIISGGAKGTDYIGELIAKTIWNKKTYIYNANWKEYGKNAGFIRNELIVKKSDVIFAFWDYKSAGTKNTIDFCYKYNKNLNIFNISEFK